MSLDCTSQVKNIGFESIILIGFFDVFKRSNVHLPYLVVPKWDTYTLQSGY